MKALSLKQPWASMIADGEKTIETRLWGTDYRGDLLICSSKQPDYMGPAGVALCIVRVVDCRPMTKDDEARSCCELYSRAWAWVLEDIRPVTPFPVKGQLGIYEVAMPAMEGKEPMIEPSFEVWSGPCGHCGDDPRGNHDEPHYKLVCPDCLRKGCHECMPLGRGVACPDCENDVE